MDSSGGQPQVVETLARMDKAWSAFQQLVLGLSVPSLEVRIGDGGWTRKQMLAHIAAWHDLTTARLAAFAVSGEPVDPPDDADAVNARTARAAVGRTTGEIVWDLDHSYRLLRRRVAALTDADLMAHAAWAATNIDGNSYGHYAEHLADLTG